MASKRPRRGTGARILMGVVRVLAAAIIAVTASAALADLEVAPIEFSRILPVVLTAEGILYILMLGGGTVAAPILLLSVILGFALRAGIAVAAGALSPQVSGDLITSAKFYYATYWPAAVAQVIMVAVALRLIRPLIATRRRRPRRGRPQVTDALKESRDDERHEVLLEALAEEPDEPPMSPTVLEERQIGDLTEAVERDLSDEEVAQALSLPFDEEAEPESETSAVEEQSEEPIEEPTEEALPPGVVDATPEAAEDQVDAEQAEAVEAPSEPEADERSRVGATDTPSPGEDTARLTPVEADTSAAVAEMAPPENLEGMIDVISRAAGEGTDVRVWRTSDGRTVLAAVPSGTPAAGTGGHADALISAHIEICQWLDGGAGCPQLVGTPIGAWALQALEPTGTVMLIMAARGEAASGRMQLAAERAADAVREMAMEAGSLNETPQTPEAASALPLSPADNATEAVREAANAVGGRLGEGWNAWRGPHRRVIAVHAAGADPQTLGQKTARMVAPIERFADAVALDAPGWVAVDTGASCLAMQWAQFDGEPIVLAAVAGGGVPVGRVRWELSEIAGHIAEQ